MNRWTTKAPLVCLLVLLYVACEHGVDIQGRVIVPQEVDRLFSPASPGDLHVEVTAPGLSVEFTDLRSAFTGPRGTPQDAEREIPITSSPFGCAGGQATIKAWAFPAAAGTGTRPLDAHTLETALAFGTTDAPVRQTGFDIGCHNGSLSFTVTLAPTATRSGP